MQNIQLTNQKFYEMHMELQTMMQGALGILLRKQIAEFYKNNGLRGYVIKEGGSNTTRKLRV